MKPLTPLQHRVLQLIYRAPMRQISLTDLGGVYKVRPGKPGDPTIGRLASHAIVMALERRGLAGMFRHGNDQWASLIFYSTDEGDIEAWTPMRPPCRTKKADLSDLPDTFRWTRQEPFDP